MNWTGQKQRLLFLNKTTKRLAIPNVTFFGMVICDPVFRLSDLLAFGDQKVTAQPFFFFKAYKRDVYLDKSQVGEGASFLGDHLAFGSWGWSQGLCFFFFLSSQKSSLFCCHVLCVFFRYVKISDLKRLAGLRSWKIHNVICLNDMKLWWDDRLDLYM